MTTQDEIEFHSERAEAELDMALGAASIQAARAHFGLSSLHIDKLQSLKASARARSHQQH